jgi:inhibitor of cysteine peptidase
MNRLARSALVFACLCLVAAGGLVASSSAPSDAVDVRLDGLVFEPGSAVALELVSAEGASCFGGNVLVDQIELADSVGNLISVVPYGTPVDAGDWLGVVMLRAGDGSDLPPGAYEIRVVTSGGTFTASLNVVPTARFASLDRFVAGVPACNLALRASRVLTELDEGARVTLRLGDRLMVLLAGNPTTGYSWSNALADQAAAVRESDEMEYRASSSLIGAGGFFVFRYWAVDRGTQDFRFEYARAWESVEPISTLTFSVDAE